MKTNVNDNLIEQGIQFLICFRFFALDMLHALLFNNFLSRRLAFIYKSRRILTIAAWLWWVRARRKAQPPQYSLLLSNCVCNRFHAPVHSSIKCILNSSSRLSCFCFFFSATARFEPKQDEAWTWLVIFARLSAEIVCYSACCIFFPEPKRMQLKYNQLTFRIHLPVQVLTVEREAFGNKLLL